MRLVGNEVGALHLVDGLNLGESCQVFVIKDLIIHFSLGGRGKGTGEKKKDKREKGERERGNRGKALKLLLFLRTTISHERRSCRCQNSHAPRGHLLNSIVKPQALPR